MTESKVVPLDEVATSVRPRSNSIYSDNSDRQHWAAEDTAAARGCCTRLATCLGFSATAAPGWVESILPGDNCALATRDGWCEKTIDPSNIYAAKRRAEQRADRHKRLTQIGQRVEVLVGAQRGWYVGKVVPNDKGVRARGKHVTVQFTNGSVLRNVRPIELRQVARMTWVYWAYLTFAVLLITGCSFIARSNAEHSLREGPRGDVWLFPDRAFTHMANTTLYSLTYGEVAAADAHPETWLAAILNTEVEEYRNLSIFGAGRNDTLCWFRDSQDYLMWQMQYFFIFVQLAAIPHFVLLRVLPLSYHVVTNIMAAVICSQLQFNRDVSTLWSSQYPDYTREQMLQQANAAAQGYAIIMTVNFGLMHIILPILYSLIRRAGLVHWFLHYWPPYFFAGFLLWSVLYMRVAYFQFILQDVLDRDITLERLASIMMYLETTKQYLDRGLFVWLPMLSLLLYAAIKIRSFKWYNYLITGIMIILVVPYVMWYYVVAQPLPFFEPVSWMVLHTQLSHEIFLAPKTGLFFLITFGSMMVVCFEFAIDWLYDAISIDCRVSSLDVRTRKALGAWAQSLTRKKVQKSLFKDVQKSMTELLSSWTGPQTKKSLFMEQELETRAIACVNANDYQPLQKRAPTEDVLRPIADHFESHLARPGTRLRPRTWGPRWLTLFSAPMQVHRVVRVMGTAIACYVAGVVHGAGTGQRQVLRETVVALVEDLGCSEEDRQLVLGLADQDQSTGGPSSINELREVTRRLGTKHRDKIYLRCMQGVGNETGFQQLVTTADQVQHLAVAGQGGQLRQTVVSAAMSWPMRVVTLLDSACAVYDRYQKFVATLATKGGGEYMPAPLKGLFRLSEKLWLRPTRNPDPQKPFVSRGDCTNVCDVVRGMIVCSTTDIMNICLGLLAACDIKIWRGLPGARSAMGHDDVTAAQAAGIVEELNIFRVKNRFKKPTPSGWADILINFSFASDPEQHICELQLVHKSMFTARRHCNAHASYAKFRTALELLETFDLATHSVHGAEATKVSGDLEDHLDFVHSQEKEYQDFLCRYQRAMGLVSSKSNTNKDDKEPAGNASVSSCEELFIELQRTQKRRREDDKKYEMQLKRIRLQLEKLSNTTQTEKM